VESIEQKKLVNELLETKVWSSTEKKLLICNEINKSLDDEIRQTLN